MEWIGYLGIAAFALAWIPQCRETLQLGRCPVNLAFLALAAVGSLCLAAYAFWRRDAVFSALNALTAAGALINIYYRLFPRGSAEGGIE